MKNISIKKIIGIIIGVVVVIGIVALILIMSLKIDSFEAQDIALKKSNGGEIVSEEISHEGLWNEYSYKIINGDKWYSIEIDGFGNITELETGSGQYPVR